MPHTNEVAQKFAGQNVAVLAVCIDGTQKPFDEWLPKHTDLTAITFAYTPYSQDKDAAPTLYHISGIPTQYVINADGKVAKSFVGYGGPTDDLANAIKTAQAK